MATEGRRLWAYLAKIAAGISAVWLVMTAASGFKTDSTTTWVIRWTALLLGGGGGWLHQFLTGSRAVNALRKQQARARVLYLRSFAKEEVTTNGWDTNEVQRLLAPALEEHLGSLVMLRNKRIPATRGATAISVDDEQWQGTVLELLDRVGAIVVVADSTESLGWELQQLRAFPHWKVFVAAGFPNGSRWSEVVERFAAAGISLPTKEPNGRTLFGFRATWEPLTLARDHASVLECALVARGWLDHHAPSAPLEAREREVVAAGRSPLRRKAHQFAWVGLSLPLFLCLSNDTGTLLTFALCVFLSYCLLRKFGKPPLTDDEVGALRTKFRERARSLPA